MVLILSYAPIMGAFVGIPVGLRLAKILGRMQTVVFMRVWHTVIEASIALRRIRWPCPADCSWAIMSDRASPWPSCWSSRFG